jgi:hypothetical protein
MTAMLAPIVRVAGRMEGGTSLPLPVGDWHEPPASPGFNYFPYRAGNGSRDFGVSVLWTGHPTTASKPTMLGI